MAREGVNVYSEGIMEHFKNKEEALNCYQELYSVYSKYDNDRYDNDVKKVKSILNQIKSDARQVYDALENTLEEIYTNSDKSIDSDELFEMIYGEENSVLADFETKKISFKELFTLDNIDDYILLKENKDEYYKQKHITKNSLTEDYDRHLEKINVDDYLGFNDKEDTLETINVNKIQNEKHNIELKNPIAERY